MSHGRPKVPRRRPTLYFCPIATRLLIVSAFYRGTARYLAPATHPGRAATALNLTCSAQSRRAVWWEAARLLLLADALQRLVGVLKRGRPRQRRSRAEWGRSSLPLRPNTPHRQPARRGGSGGARPRGGGRCGKQGGAADFLSQGGAGFLGATLARRMRRVYGAHGLLKSAVLTGSRVWPKVAAGDGTRKAPISVHPVAGGQGCVSFLRS